MSEPVIPDKRTTTPFPQADYYEGNAEGFDVYSWSPSPQGTDLKTAPVTQVHLHGLVSFGRLFWRFKSNRSLDRLIGALLKHRWDVWRNAYEPEMEAEMAFFRDLVLEEAASLHESVSPASDEERENGAPGAGAMGAVIEYRDKLRALKGRR